MKNESHDDDDDDAHEVDTPKTDQTFDNLMNEHDLMQTARNDANFSYTNNCHPQKSLMVGDTNWIV